jgi:hypothetical protein
MQKLKEVHAAYHPGANLRGTQQKKTGGTKAAKGKKT